MSNVTFDLKGKTLTITVADVTKVVKASEKMDLCASTGGFTGIGTVDGKAVKASVLVGWKR